MGVRAEGHGLEKTRRGAAERARLWRRRSVRGWGARVSGPFYVSWAQRWPSDLESGVKMTWAEHSNLLILKLAHYCGVTSIFNFF